VLLVRGVGREEHSERVLVVSRRRSRTRGGEGEGGRSWRVLSSKGSKGQRELTWRDSSRRWVWWLGVERKDGRHDEGRKGERRCLKKEDGVEGDRTRERGSKGENRG